MSEERLARLRIWDRDDWRTGSRDLSSDEYQRIVGAVRGGRALDDPFEAAMAVGCAHGWSRRALWGLVLTVVVIVPTAVVTVVVEGVRDGASVFLAVIAPIGAWYARGRAHRAEERNRAVVEEALAGIRPLPPEKGTLTDAMRIWRRNLEGPDDPRADG